MRNTASFAAFVALMAVTGSNGAPIGTPNGSSARSVSRTRAQLRSRNFPSLASNVQQDASPTADVPDLECGDCRKNKVKNVLADVARPLAHTNELKYMSNAHFSADVQVPGVPSGSGSVDFDYDFEVNEDKDPNTGASTRPEEPPSDGTSNDSNNDGKTDENQADESQVDESKADDSQADNSQTDDGKADNGQAEDSGKADPHAEQPPCDKSHIDLEDVQDEFKQANQVVDDESRDIINDIESASSQAHDDIKAALSSTNDDIHELNDEISSMPKVVAVSQEPCSEKPEDSEDEITVEMRKGNSSVSTSVFRR